MKSKPRAWQRMLSGRRLDLLDPSPFDIELEDIAHGLSRVARWNGQTHGEHAFSVAQHSVLVLDIFEQLVPDATIAAKKAALLHDASEYVVGDMISPFKAALSLDYRAFEEQLLEAVFIRFQIPVPLKKSWKVAIKRADIVSAFCEATQLAGFNAAEAEQLFGKPEIETLPRLTPISPNKAKTEFLERFNALV